MPRLEIRPFAPEFVDEAAGLLARRHAEQRAVESSLPIAYERLEISREAIVELLAAEASGAVATRSAEVVGFLLGTTRPNEIWGPNTWVEPAGHAVVDPEVVRDLYGFAAARWVAEGRASHYAVVPATDAALVDAWFRLGFGQQHVHAIRELPAAAHAEPPPDVVIRQPTRDDLDTLAELDRVLLSHQQLSPVFSSLEPPSWEKALEEWGDDFDDPAFTTFVAVVDGRVVGSAIGCSVDESGLHTGIARPDAAAHLGFAAVLEDARGRGIGSALGVAVLDWASAAGYEAIVTDWRATNLLSSRTWPKLGFRPTFYRLFRAIT